MHLHINPSPNDNRKYSLTNPVKISKKYYIIKKKCIKYIYTTIFNYKIS